MAAWEAHVGLEVLRETVAGEGTRATIKENNAERSKSRKLFFFLYETGG